MKKGWIVLILWAVLVGQASWTHVQAGTGPRKTYLPIIYKQVTGSPSMPTPGYYASSGDADSFYVLPDRAWVQNFAVIININGCGTYKISHTAKEAISGGQFGFTGSFYASGTFTSATAATGQVGFKDYSLPGCGIINGGPWTWNVIWKNANQPAPTETIAPGR